MPYHGALQLAKHIAGLGFQVIVAKASSDGDWCILVLNDWGRQIANLYTEQDFHEFMQQHQPHKTTERFLLCPICSHAYSANPAHYGGRDGIFTHCGRALQLWRTSTHGSTLGGYLVAESVDLEYLQRPHADNYGDYEPIERNAPPTIPLQLRLHPIELNAPLDPVFSLEQWGYILYGAGYSRGADGMWSWTEHPQYSPMQEGDTIERRYMRGYSFSFTLAEQWNASTKGPIYTFWSSKEQAA